MDRILKVNAEFQSKYECFSCFKDLIKNEIFDLIDNNTNAVPLYEVNELIGELEEYYILVNIIDQQRIKNVFYENYEYMIYDRFSVEAYYEFIPTKGYLFLFIQKGEKYKFLGLYKSVETDINEDRYIQKWKRQEIKEFYLSKTKIKELIEKLDYNDIELYKDSEFVIEKFDYNKIEKYINNREKLKEILTQHGIIYKFLPEELKNDEELAIAAIQKDEFRRYPSIYSNKTLE